MYDAWPEQEGDAEYFKWAKENDRAYASVLVEYFRDVPVVSKSCHRWFFDRIVLRGNSS